MVSNLPPKKPKNKDRREREYLTAAEIDKLIKAARKIGRHKDRDAAMILIAYRHALRVSELVRLRWSQVELDAARIHVTRLKNGADSVHPLYGVEIRALRKLKRKYPDTSFVFSSERKGPLTPSAFGKMLGRAGKIADLGISVHPHMLRHSTGFKLANDGHDTRSIQHYFGHKNIQHTTRYTELSSKRFEDFWKD